MVVVFGCGAFRVVDLRAKVLLHDRFSKLAPVPFGFSTDGLRMRVTLGNRRRAKLPFGP